MIFQIHVKINTYKYQNLRCLSACLEDHQQDSHPLSDSVQAAEGLDAPPGAQPQPSPPSADRSH